MTTPAPPPVVAVAEVFRALASPKRLQILEWLRDPVANFPPQRLKVILCTHTRNVASRKRSLYTSPLCISSSATSSEFPSCSPGALWLLPAAFSPAVAIPIDIET